MQFTIIESIIIIVVVYMLVNKSNNFFFFTFSFVLYALYVIHNF